jgi:hypothetical protein
MLASINMAKFKVWTGTGPGLTEQPYFIDALARLRGDSKAAILVLYDLLAFQYLQSSRHPSLQSVLVGGVMVLHNTSGIALWL